MTIARNWMWIAAIAVSSLLVGCGSSTHIADRHSPQCSLGKPTGEEHQLIAPRPGTFYSVDALNPDVVAFHGRYFMYFSGNNVHTEKGNWRTGLAVAKSPTGPFYVQHNLEGNYLNGGTAIWRGVLWHAVEDNPTIRGELASSTDGIHWRHESFIPGFPDNGVTYHGADFFLEPEGSRLGVYMLAFTPSGGIGRSLGFASYKAGRWSRFHIILNINTVKTLDWSSADLGEPASFYLKGRHYLLFVGLSRDDRTRSIGLARESSTGWDVCDNIPALSNGASWGPASSIDPSPLVVGNRLYLYYGATRTKGLSADLGGSIGLRVFAER
jgi:hypothetical protein